MRVFAPYFAWIVVAALCAPAALARAQDAGAPTDDELLAELAQQLSAPDAGADAQDPALDEIVVTGTRTETAIDDSAARVQVITRAQIESSGARDAAELLEEQPGVLIQRSFRGDAIQLAGLDPEYTLILVDGERVPGRIGGGIDLGRFGVESIERIEVLRGPGSALYGSDAIAGVVNIILRPPSPGFRADGSVMYGYGAGHMIDANATASGTIGPVSARIQGGYHYAQPWDADPSTPATTGSGRDQWSLGGRIEWRPIKQLKLDVRADYLTRSLTGVDQNDAGAVFDRTQLGEQLQLSVGEVYQTRGGTRLTARIAFSLFREQYLYDQRGSTALDDVQDNREYLGQGTLQLDHNFGKHRVSAGFEGLIQTLSSARLTQFGSRSRYSPFVQDDWTIVDDGQFLLVAIAGIRVDVDSQFGTQASPRVGLRFDPIANKLVLRATYGLGFRAPSFQELSLRFENPSVGYLVSGNPNLQAERSRGLDAGIEYNPLDWMRLTAYYFRNDLDNMIAIVTTDDSAAGTLFTYGNISRAYTQGVDASIRVKPLAWLTAQATYSFLNTRDQELNRALEGRPVHRVTLLATLAHPGTGIGANARMSIMGPREFFEDTDGNGSEESVWSDVALQLDVRVSKTITRYGEVFAGVDNVLDAGDAYLFIRPRTFFGGFRGRYDGL